MNLKSKISFKIQNIQGLWKFETYNLYREIYNRIWELSQLQDYHRGKSHLYSLSKLFSKTSNALQWEEESLYRLLQTDLNYFEAYGSEIFRIHWKLFVFLCRCLWIWRRFWSLPFWRAVLDELSAFSQTDFYFTKHHKIVFKKLFLKIIIKYDHSF